MIIDNELVLLDNKDVNSISTSDVIKLPVTYKAMFLYVKVTGGDGDVTSTLKVSKKSDMSSAKELMTVKTTATNKKGYTMTVVPAIEGREPCYVRLDSTKTVSAGKVFAGFVSDVNVR